MAQTDYDNGKKYTIAELKITGLQTYNEQTVKTYTGLREGMLITIPGEQISAIINKLWDLELFSDINFYLNKVEGDQAFLELEIIERPVLSEVKVVGINPRKVDGIVEDTDLKKGKKITKSLISNTKNYLENKYKDQGYLNAKVLITTKNDTASTNSQQVVINIDKGTKVKISDIVFEGNENLKVKKLKKALKKTKVAFPGRFWKKSKYIPEDYDEDLGLLIDAYAENGFRDARILSDTITKIDDERIALNIKIEEGKRYYFGDIDFVGNTVYSDKQLSSVLGIKKGDTYNGVLLRKRIADNSKPDGEDVTNLYQNNGYLFSSINPVEIAAANDTIDFEIRIIEGKETFLNHVTVAGNDRTNDHVIFRELRTRPGQRYSKDNIIRSIRELGQLGFFDAEQISPDVQNADPNSGTVDLHYDLVESGSSQIELQGGYGNLRKKK
jgi:outer membrane protein insertion porin family